MGKCVVCGKKGLFLKISSNGLCSECENKRIGYEKRMEEDRQIVIDQVGKGLFPGHLKSFVVTDIETTGLSCNSDDIIELAAIRVIDGNAADSFSTLISGRKITPEITRITGIKQKMIDDSGIPLKDAIEKYRILVGGLPLVGHNIISFDSKFLKRAYQIFDYELENRLVDTLDLSRDYIESSSYKLSLLQYYLGLDGGTSHRALGDCQTTLSLYRYLDKVIPEPKPPRPQKPVMINDTDRWIMETVRSLTGNNKYLRFEKMSGGYLRIKGYYTIADIKTDGAKVKDFVVFRYNPEQEIVNRGNLRTTPEGKTKPSLRYFFESQEDFLTIADDIIRIFSMSIKTVEENMELEEWYRDGIYKYLNDPGYIK